MRVTGTFLDANDQPRAGETLRFLNETSPQADVLGVITAKIIETTLNDDGKIITVDGEDEEEWIVLEQGLYLVHVGPNKRDWFRILVDGTDDTANITALLTDQEQDDLDQDGVNYRVKSGFFQLKNVDTGAWHTVRIVGEAGLEQLEIVIPGMYLDPITTGSNYRVQNDVFQLVNVDTGLYHTVRLAGQPGTEQFDIVIPGEA